jgi:hypothetical protein
LPGVYAVRLTAAGRSVKQPLTVKMDPRVKTPLAGLQHQFTLSMQMYDGIATSARALRQVNAVRAQLDAARAKAAAGPLAEAIAALDQKLMPLAGPATGRRGARGAAPATRDLGRLNGELAQLFGLLQEADAAPPSQNVAAARELSAVLTSQLAAWRQIVTMDVPALNAKLKQAGQSEIEAK